MQHIDRNTDPNRLNPEVRPLIQSLLNNRQLFDADQDDTTFLTGALKYASQQQKRRQTSPYDGNNQFVKDIIEIFGFDPLDFQINSWQIVDELERAQRKDGRTKAAIFSAPTGFGKTEAFLGPLYQLLREGRQESVAIVYPSRALLQDQLGRILEHIHIIREKTGDELSAGVYVGRQPYELGDVSGNGRFFDQSQVPPRFRLTNCWCGDGSNALEYHGSSRSYALRCEKHPEEHTFTDRDLVLARKELVSNNQPNIILTTLESLEGFALKPNYPLVDLIDTIVLDEIHLYTQLRGSHAANVIKNVNDASDDPILWLGSSATIDNANRFGKRLFDVSSNDIETEEPPASDFDEDHDDYEHYYFLLADPDGPGAAPMSIQQHMMLGHSLLEDENGDRSKLLGFIDSISQVNQKRIQLEDADSDRELWRYHTDREATDDWPWLAEQMDHAYIDEPLSFMPVYSDAGFDSESASESDVLLSTSFLEVGIDVGEIKIVTQYRTPWNLSSFLQRAGRAAREPGMDAHIVVFLSNLTGDANMFYRADRFLGSEIRTPLKTDNSVVEWIHECLRKYYNRATEVRENRHQYITQREAHLAFLDGYLVDDLGFDRVYHMIDEPRAFFEDEFDIEVTSESLLSKEIVQEVRNDLARHVRDLEDEFEDIEGYFDVDGGEIVRGSDAVGSHLDDVQDEILALVKAFLGQTGGYESVLREAGDSNHEENARELRDTLENIRQRASSAEGSPSERVEHFSVLLADIFRCTGDLIHLRTAANAATDRAVPTVKMDELQAVQQAVDQLDALTTDDRLAEYYRTQRRVYYLQSALSELEEYVDYYTPYLSVFAVKHLLRAAYYVDRYLQVDGDRLAREVWYVPPNYYGDTGRYVTVFRGENDRDGTEESIDQLVSTYAPYRSEYQSDSGVMQAFLPQTRVTEDGVEFEFKKDISGEERDGMLVPETIRTSEITDLTGDRALNIVRYCPECLQILTNIDSCLRHNDRAYGKIHSTANVNTRVTERVAEESTGTLTLADFTAAIELDGVTLDIKPAKPMGPDIGYHFDSSKERFQREISSPDTPLGFQLETRGLVFDIEPFLEGIDDDLRAEVTQYKNLDEVDYQHLLYHTAAHFFLQLTADVSSVNTTMLLYGFDEEKGEVYVFERSEGGQGIVDLVYEELRTDPGSVLEAITRLTYNEQVIAERLWADEEFVDEFVAESAADDQIRGLIKTHLEVLYDDVIDRVEEEIISTVDRCRQFEADEGVTLAEAIRTKHVVAREQVGGADEFPEDEVSALEADIDDVDRVETMFYSPDIDGCVENLHLSECISGHDQKDSLSYVVLETLRNFILTTSPSENATSAMFDRELPPAGEIDGTSVFIDF
ncbi:DEAD/DEAH box helicase [Natrialbaceae archaeon A-chndr2]